ncbi:hypothetical protein DFJ73DRAFT_192323 [Zopfochytrium polystomum]|nr:hypothetical protein DFJ73DRAFT_192323 [Zopfochytrium polystomum]
MNFSAEAKSFLRRPLNCTLLFVRACVCVCARVCGVCPFCCPSFLLPIKLINLTLNCFFFCFPPSLFFLVSALCRAPFRFSFLSLPPLVVFPFFLPC